MKIVRERDTGGTSVEYALMASLIAVVIAGAVTTFGTAVSDLFENLVTLMGW